MESIIEIKLETLNPKKIQKYSDKVMTKSKLGRHKYKSERNA